MNGGGGLRKQEHRKTLPSVGQIMIDHTGLTEVTVQQLDEALSKEIPLD